MAVRGRAPDITERTVIDLSGSNSTYYQITGNAFDVAVAGQPFLMAATDATPYRRQTAEFRTNRVDQERDPGEQSLSGSGYWIRSQSSWHLGAGINYSEPIDGDIATVRFRFKDSIGVDPWTPGQLSLLRNTSLLDASNDRSGVFSTEINGVSYLIKVTGSASEPARVIRYTTAGTATTIITNSQITEEILYGAMGGNDLMLVTPTKVWRYSFDQPVPALHQDYAINAANAVSAYIGYVKQRFMLCYDDVAGKTYVYELPINTGGSINLSTLTPVNGSATLPIGFKFTAVAESSTAIYVGGFSGDEGMAFKILVSNTGTLSTMERAIALPKGERLTSMYGYLGTFLMLGTSRGVRVAISEDTDGKVSYGPLLFESSDVYAFTAANEYVWAGVNGKIGGQSGLIRINLGAPLGGGRYAYANDIYAGQTSGNIWAIALFNGGRKAFTLEDSGLWLESEDELVESGDVTTGIIRFDTLENKAWKRIRLRTPLPVTGDVEMFRVDGTDTFIKAAREGEEISYEYDLAVVFDEVTPDAQFKFRLYRSQSDNTVGAILYGYSVKALPTPTRARILQIPVFLYDKETDKLGNLIGYEGYARQRLSALELAESQGETVIIQDFTAGGETFEVILEQVSFTRTTPPARNFTGFGGIVTIIARTVV